MFVSVGSESVIRLSFNLRGETGHIYTRTYPLRYYYIQEFMVQEVAHYVRKPTNPNDNHASENNQVAYDNQIKGNQIL